MSDYSSTIDAILFAWNALQSSALFRAFEIFLGVYALVLLVDVILLTALRDIRADIKKTFYGTKRPMVSAGKTEKRWQAILARIGSGNPSQYKVAVLEADALADEMLKGIGYAGANMKERLAQMKEGEILAAEQLKAAHAIRNRIIQDPDFTLAKEEAEVFLKQYEALFNELELL
jgi:hypothetical protein